MLSYLRVWGEGELVAEVWKKQTRAQLEAAFLLAVKQKRVLMRGVSYAAPKTCQGQWALGGLASNFGMSFECGWRAAAVWIHPVRGPAVCSSPVTVWGHR